MKLSIVITHYKEPVETCKPLFDSIAIQQGINLQNDIDVIVVNDGKDVIIPDSFINGYPFKVRYLLKKHEGVSAARNFGLDRAEGDYVMFCDIDDMFLDVLALRLIRNAMDEGFDTMVSTFIEEQYLDDGGYKLYTHDTKDATFIHGKVHNIKYLLDNNIRFDENLTIHEDGYFNFTAQTCTERKKLLNTPIYLWKWNPNSVVRSNKQHFVIRTYDHVMKARAAMCRECKKRGLEKQYKQAIVKTVLDSYYDFNKPDYLNPKNKEIVEKAEQAFKWFYKQYGEDFKKVPIDMVAEISNVARLNAYSNGFHIEQKTLSQWLTHIVKEVADVTLH